MSHLHLVDGILSPIWWVTGYLLTFAILGFAVSKIKKDELSKKVPYIGVIGALMLITMSVPLGFLPFHLNLTVLAGILAGPWIGFIAVFIVNLIMAFIGHGGITVVGVNTLIIGTEVILGYYFFSYLRNHLKPVKAVAVTVIFILLISTSLMVGLVALSNTGVVYALPDSEHQHEEVINQNDEEHNYEETDGLISEIHIFSISGWSALIAILLLGIAIEAAVTAMVISYFLKVRPDMIIPEIVTNENSEIEITEV